MSVYHSVSTGPHPRTSRTCTGSQISKQVEIIFLFPPGTSVAIQHVFCDQFRQAVQLRYQLLCFLRSHEVEAGVLFFLGGISHQLGNRLNAHFLVIQVFADDILPLLALPCHLRQKVSDRLAQCVPFAFVYLFLNLGYQCLHNLFPSQTYGNSTECS